MEPYIRPLMMGAAGAVSPTYIEDVFSTWLYTGNGSTQTITNGIDLSGKGGLVWVKGRGSTSFGNVDHSLHDSARGVTNSLLSNSTSQQFDQTTSGVTAFNSNGFAIGNGPRYNESPVSYASWTFRKAAKFFDVVTWTGSGANRTIGHSLGSVPGTIFVKRTDNAGDWQVYHRSLANTEYLVLNTTATKATGATRWNSTTPTSTAFSLGTDASVNANGGTYVAYLFAHDAGGFGDAGTDNVVSCGSYTGSGSSGSFEVDLGWEPQWVLIKAASSGGINYEWAIVDTMRGFLAPNTPGLSLFANTTDTEFPQEVASITAKGFRPIGTSNISNQSGVTYIYIAIRRGPMKTPTVGTTVFSMVDRAGTGATATVSGFTNLIDALIVRGKANGYAANFYDRLRGATRVLLSNTTDSEITNGNTLNGFDEQTGYKVGSDNAGYGINNVAGGPYINWGFRRAPGFFDVVCFTGSSSGSQTIPHNLGVAPELLITKARAAAVDWYTYSAILGINAFLRGVNSVDGSATSSGMWPNTPTASNFYINVDNVGLASRTAVAYLFASCPGVSKCFSFTGNGSSQTINCGFASGARFVLIKRTDSTGNWLVADTARGIVSGNDPLLYLNTSTAEITTLDWLDPDSTGFIVNQESTANANVNGATYIGLAIA